MQPTKRLKTVNIISEVKSNLPKAQSSNALLLQPTNQHQQRKRMSKYGEWRSDREGSDLQFWLTLWFHSVYTHEFLKYAHKQIYRAYEPALSFSSFYILKECVLHCNFRAISTFFGSASFVYICLCWLFLVTSASVTVCNCFSAILKLLSKKKQNVSYLRDLFVLLNIRFCFLVFFFFCLFLWVHCVFHIIYSFSYVSFAFAALKSDILTLFFFIMCYFLHFKIVHDEKTAWNTWKHN